MTASFELLLISSEQDLKSETKTLVELFNLGLSTFHLRKPGWLADEMEQWLTSLPKEFHNRVVLHSHFELAEKFGLKGIHLNEKNKSLVSQLNRHKIISASFHSLEDLKANTFPYEHVFLSPIFDSISKVGYKSNFDLKLLKEGLREMKEQNPALPKVIGLGGIHALNISQLKEAGFSGAALLGSVWESENPVRTFSEIQELIKGKV
jgi:thiamine-phosphate pyrophosphorylase